VSESFGDRLKWAMRAAHLSNEDVAAACGVHINTVSYWRNDGQRPRDDDLETVLRLLRERGVILTAAQLRYGPLPPSPADATARAEEARHLIAQVRETGMRYATRRAQGAPPDELTRLSRALTLAIRNAIEVTAPDPEVLDQELLDGLTSAFYDLMTVDATRRPARRPAAKRSAEGGGSGSPQA
jgi:transcriptional regulator with XRE-family HTH domain